MPTQPISNEVALRIALAARALPDTSVGDLIEALQNNLDDLTEASLSKVTVTQLKRAFGNIYEVDEGEWEGEDADNEDIACFKEAVRILWGEISNGEDNSPIVTTNPENLPNSFKVAVASNSAEQLDGHFGSCHRFLIYQISPEHLQLIEVRSTVEADLSDDKNKFRVDLIRDCAVLYVASIGGPAAAKVIQANIYPMKKEAGGEAREVLGELQQAIKNSPAPWLAKILGVDVDKRVKNYTAVS